MGGDEIYTQVHPCRSASGYAPKELRIFLLDYDGLGWLWFGSGSVWVWCGLGLVWFGVDWFLVALGQLWFGLTLGRVWFGLGLPRCNGGPCDLGCVGSSIPLGVYFISPHMGYHGFQLYYNDVLSQCTKLPLEGFSLSPL